MDWPYNDRTLPSHRMRWIPIPFWCTLDLIGSIMSLPQDNPIFTVEEYLALERSSEERHEYLDGQIFSMAGESGAHADLTVNLTGILHDQLRGTPCRARSKDTKVRSGPVPAPGRSTSGLYSYPDLLVVCGDPQYHDTHTDVIINPTVLIEVLSPSTEAFDRGEKFVRYQIWNPTVQDYLLVSQDRARIEVYHRQVGGGWSYSLHEGRQSIVQIPTIACRLSLSDVYDRVIPWE